MKIRLKQGLLTSFDRGKNKKECESNMVTPTREQIEKLARELYVADQYRNGTRQHAEINPETYELIESGYYSTAQNELMRDQHRAQIESEYIDFPEAFTVDLNELYEANGLILGSRHTGKSDLGMYVAERAIKDKAIVVCFDPSLDWIARSGINRYVQIKTSTNLDVPSESVIYDVSLLSPIQQQRTVEQFSKRLFEGQVKEGLSKQYLMIFEEAHTYFYQGCMRAKNMQNTVRLLSVGRNLDIACLLISQFASMLDKFAIKHSTSQAWFGYTREPNDIRYLRQILGEDVENLTSLQDGEFLYLTRNKLCKISIKPFQNNTPKRLISIPEFTPMPKMKLQKTENTKALVSLIVALMWLAAIILALSQLG